MKMIARRTFVAGAAGVAMSSLLPRRTRALDYPARPVRLVVGFPPGQSGDLSARLLGQWLSDHLGQPFVIDNRPGAASTIATDIVAHAPPDGYTLLWVVTSNYVNATLEPNLPYDFVRDITPIASSNRTPLVLEVHPSVPVTTVAEFIAYAKANPGNLNMASGGNGNSTHMAGELFKMLTGVQMIHVPYRGSTPALTDLLAGRVQVMFDLMPSSIGYIKAGKLRALAVTTTTRSATLPELPTVADFVPGYEASGLGGIGAPRGVSAEIVNAINTEVNAALNDATIKARFAQLGSMPLPGSPADFAKLIGGEIDKWRRVIEFAGVKAGAD